MMQVSLTSVYLIDKLFHEVSISIPHELATGRLKAREMCLYNIRVISIALTCLFILGLIRPHRGPVIVGQNVTHIPFTLKHDINFRLRGEKRAMLEGKKLFASASPDTPGFCGFVRGPRLSHDNMKKLHEGIIIQGDLY